METCRGCAVAQAGTGFVSHVCTGVKGCALEELRETHEGAHMLNKGECEYEHIAEMVQRALDNPPTILPV